jgi:hypothetical protein
LGDFAFGEGDDSDAACCTTNDCECGRRVDTKGGYSIQVESGVGGGEFEYGCFGTRVPEYEGIFSIGRDDMFSWRRLLVEEMWMKGVGRFYRRE